MTRTLNKRTRGRVGVTGVTAIGVAFAVTLLLAPGSSAKPAHASKTSTRSAGHFPSVGIFIPGTSLGGIKLGETMAAVQTQWGSRYTLCKICKLTTWFYIYPVGEPLGAAVTFSRATSRVVAIWTLGAPDNWHTDTKPPIMMHADPYNLTSAYGTTGYTDCVYGFSALTLRTGNSISVFYSNGFAIYGFGLFIPSQPVCN